MPHRAEFESQIDRVQLDLWNLPRKEEEVIEKLLIVFRQINPVSVLLRLLHPADYGIYSAPVLEILETRRELTFQGALKSTPKIYMTYLENLRGLAAERGFERVADVETAIWALYEGVLRRRLPGTEHLERAFWDDRGLRAIRVRNLVNDLLNKTPPEQLADSLLEVDRLRSAQFAGLEFEKRVRHFAELNDAYYDDENCLYDVVERLVRERLIDSTQAGFWHKARKVRNKAAHGRIPQDVDVRFLLQELRKLPPV
jgi:hypothetical protein